MSVVLFLIILVGHHRAVHLFQQAHHLRDRVRSAVMASVASPTPAAASASAATTRHRVRPGQGHPADRVLPAARWLSRPSSSRRTCSRSSPRSRPCRRSSRSLPRGRRRPPTWDNFKTIFTQYDFGRYLAQHAHRHRHPHRRAGDVLDDGRLRVRPDGVPRPGLAVLDVPGHADGAERGDDGPAVRDVRSLRPAQHVLGDLPAVRAGRPGFGVLDAAVLHDDPEGGDGGRPA